MTTHPIELLRPRGLKHLSKTLASLIYGRLWLKVIIGMVAGVGVGYLLNPATGFVDEQISRIVADWIALPGKFFLTMVQMIVVPLVFASVIRGIAANHSIKQLKNTGLKLVIYFLITTALAVIIGIFLSSILQPGNYIDISQVGGHNAINNINFDNFSGKESKSIPSILIGLLPNNPVSDAVESNMLQIVIFSIIVGLAMVTMSPEQSKPLFDLLGSVLTVSMTIIRWVMTLAPYAVFGLIAHLVINTGLDAFIGIGVFIISVLIGLALLMIMYLIIVGAVGRFSPWSFISKIRDAQLLAFSTGSSAATMPISLKTVEDNLKVRPSIAQFVIPIGATINMNATALFQGMAVMFFAQIYGLDLAFGALVILIVTIIGSSIGAPATPGVGIVVLSVVLKGVGIPLEGLVLIIGIDQIMERFRAMLNVTGDLVASVVINRIAPTPGTPTYEEEIAHDKMLEQQRKSTGEDIIIQ